MPNENREVKRDVAGAWAKRYFLASRALMEALLRPHDLGRTQWYVLHLLATEGPLAQRDLSKALDVERATLSTIVSAVVRKGFVVQETSAGDQRQRTLHLTASGRALWKRLPDPVEVIARVAFGDVDPDELATAERVLTEATDRLNRYREKEL